MEAQNIEKGVKTVYSKSIYPTTIANSGTSHRPNEKMPVSAHAEAGALLGEVLAATTHRKRIGEPVARVLCTLDSWTMSEYSYEELPDEIFHKLYCGTRTKTFKRRISAQERESYISNLQRVQEILVEHYPDCDPLQELLKNLSDAVTALEAWIPL